MAKVDARASSLSAALRILEHWGCSDEQQRQILGVEKTNPEQAELTEERFQRISHVLNIHAALRTIFSNLDNVYGFMSMKNKNAGFAGESPLELIESGSLDELASVAERVQSLTEGGW